MFTTHSLAEESTVSSTGPRDTLRGQRLGDYEVQQIIGQGGMGIVYRGLQPVIQKNVAIKVLRREVSGDAVLVKRFLSEARAVNAIGHRNIIDIFTMGELPDGRPYIVMEFLEGTPLDAYLKERAPLPPLEAVELLLDIAAPLQAAHTAGVIHRDLKPSNVFLVKQSDGTRYLKLLDFGLAKQSFDGHSAQTSAAMVTGTPDYMSPEQARGAEVSPRTDLYSLGVMAFEMITGTIPFRGTTPMDVLIQHVQSPPPKPSSKVDGIPQSLEDLVLSLLEKDPTARLAPTEKVRSELRVIQRELMNSATRLGTPLSEQRVPSVTGPRRPIVTPDPLPELGQKSPSATRRAFAAGVAAFGLVLGCGLAWLAWHEKNDDAAVVAQPPKPAVAAPVHEPTPAPLPEPAPAPEPVNEKAPPAPPTAAVKPRPRPKPAPPPAAESAATLDALSNRISRLELRLKKSAEPGEEPDPAAMVLLRKIKVQLVTSHSQEDRNEVQKSLDSWESTFLLK